MLIYLPKKNWIPSSNGDNATEWMTLLIVTAAVSICNSCNDILFKKLASLPCQWSSVQVLNKMQRAKNEIGLDCSQKGSKVSISGLKIALWELKRTIFCKALLLKTSSCILSTLSRYTSDITFYSSSFLSLTRICFRMVARYGNAIANWV